MKHDIELTKSVAANDRSGPLATVWPGQLDVDPHHGQQLIHHGYTVLLSNADGSIADEGRQGLFDHDTRILSRHEIVLDGLTPRVDSTGLVDPSHWIARLTVARADGSAHGPRLPQDAFELTLRRAIGNGMIETIDIDNHSAAPDSATLAIRVDADFCDVAEVAGPRRPRGSVSDCWDARNRALTIDYRASHENRRVHRAVRIRVLRPDSQPQVDGKTMTFDVHLQPHGSWHTELAYELLVDERWFSPIEGRSMLLTRQRLGEAWQRDRAHVESNPSSNEPCRLVREQSHCLP